VPNKLFGLPGNEVLRQSCGGHGRGPRRTNPNGSPKLLHSPLRGSPRANFALTIRARVRITSFGGSKSHFRLIKSTLITIITAVVVVVVVIVEVVVVVAEVSQTAGRRKKKWLSIGPRTILEQSVEAVVVSGEPKISASFWQRIVQ